MRNRTASDAKRGCRPVPPRGPVPAPVASPAPPSKHEGAPPRAQRTATIASSVGLHARPAALFVQAAGETGLDVEIGRPGEDAVDATSILGVMALGAKFGEEVVLTADGDGADEALDGLVALLSRDLDAE